MVIHVCRSPAWVGAEDAGAVFVLLTGQAPFPRPTQAAAIRLPKTYMRLCDLLSVCYPLVVRDIFCYINHCNKHISILPSTSGLLCCLPNPNEPGGNTETLTPRGPILEQ